jgi:predicted aldo/keto reductase-like oxidoreductase
MTREINRRTFLEQTARTAAAGAVLGGLDTWAADGPADTQPALEWRNKQPTMEYARLGRTNFMASRCIFGAGGLYRSGGATRLLEIAIERGMNYLDTGRPYASSEATIAPIAKKYRDRLWIVSKAGHIGWPDMRIKPGQGAEAARLYTDQLEESLRQLQVDTIDCYMVQGVEHDWVVTMDELYEAFVKARDAGKVRYFGLATHTHVAKVCELAAKTKRYDVVMLAVNPNSLADLSPAIRVMREAGIGVVSMKTAGPITKDPKVYDKTYAQAFGGPQLTPYQRAYAYMLARGGIDAFNSHMPNVKILEENIVVPTMELSRVALSRIETQTLAESRGACRHCGRCNEACPEGVDVAGLLRCNAYIHTYRDPDFAREQYQLVRADRTRRCGDCTACLAACPESIDLPAVIRSVRATLA